MKRKEQDKGDTRGLHVRTQVEPGHWEQSSPNNPKKVSVAARGVKHTHSHPDPARTQQQNNGNPEEPREKRKGPLPRKVEGQKNQGQKRCRTNTPARNSLTTNSNWCNKVSKAQDAIPQAKSCGRTSRKQAGNTAQRRWGKTKAPSTASGDSPEGIRTPRSGEVSFTEALQKGGTPTGANGRRGKNCRCVGKHATKVGRLRPRRMNARRRSKNRWQVQQDAMH